MRRLSFVISSALLLAGGLNSLLAQHAGGHASGGHASGGHASGGGFHSGSGPSSTTYSTLSNHYPSPGQTVYPTPIGLQHQYSGYTGINPGVLSNGNNRHGSRGYGYVGGYWYPPYLYSSFDDYNAPYAYNQSGQDPAAQAADVNANMLGQQVAQLSAEVDALRTERDPSSYAPPTYPPYNAPTAQQDPAPPPPPSVTLVLHSGKQVQLKNYAVMGQDIWDFSVQPAKRIPLAGVDLSASRTATEANGGEFPEIR